MHFYSGPKLCIQSNLRALILYVTKVLSNPSPKIPKSIVFSQRFKDFYFSIKHCNKTNLRTLISNITIAFRIPAQKYPNKVIFILNLSIFIFA